jgi:hypothetical protein
MGEDSLLERVTAAAEERQLSQNSLIAYRRTWLEIIAWAAAEGLVLETFPIERVGEFYEEGPAAEAPRITSGPNPKRCPNKPPRNHRPRQHQTVWLALAKRATPRRVPR